MKENIFYRFFTVEPLIPNKAESVTESNVIVLSGIASFVIGSHFPCWSLCTSPSVCVWSPDSFSILL